MKCRCCSSNHISHLYKLKESDLYKCEYCSFVQIEPRPTDETLKKIYNPDYFSHNKYFDKKTQDNENRRRLNLLKKYIVPDSDKKILDFGCAGGEFISFTNSYYDMYGIDYSGFAVEKAREKLPHLKKKIFVEKSDYSYFEDNYFDAIVLWDVIEHIFDFKQTLTKILKSLKTGGFLFISTPNIGSFSSKIAGKHWAFMTPPEHLSFFSEKSIKYLFNYVHNCKLEYFSSKGKKVNVGFLLYKIKKKFPMLISSTIIKLFSKKAIRGWSVYVPTGDIIYTVLRKE